MKKKPIAMKKGGAPKTSLRPKARPLSKKEQERKERDAMMKGLRQKTAMRHGLDDYGRGKAVSEGKLKDKPAEKSESFLFTLPEEKKKGGAVKKKMGGGMVKKKGYSKGGAMKKKGYAKGGKTVARGSGAARTQYFGKNG